MTQSPRWQAGAVLSLLSLAGSAMPDSVAILGWQRDAIGHGQLSRLLTAHFAHLGTHHLLFNLLGLGLVAELLMERWPWKDLATLILLSATGTSVLLWYLAPDVQWYAGLSGLLHGLWAGAALHGCLMRRSPLHVCALCALAVKLVCMNHGAAAMPVLPVAHVFGAVSGLLWALMRRILIAAPFRLK